MTDNTPAVVKPPPLPVPRMEINDLAALARAVATNVKPLDQTLNDHNLTEQQYVDYVLTNPFFQKALEAMVIEWEGVGNTEKRLKLRSQAALDDTLHILAARMGNQDENLPAVIDAAKFFAGLGGLIGRSDNQQAAVGEKFVIKIDLGADTQIRLEKDVTPKADTGAEAQVDQAVLLQSVGTGGEATPERERSGDRSEAEIQPHPEGSGAVPQKPSA